MRRYSANYAHTDHNFVLQQLPAGQCAPEHHASFCVLANLLHRGVPTRMSARLREYTGDIQGASDFTPYDANDQPTVRQLIPTAAADWGDLIKGSDDSQLFPAREFFEALPRLFPDHPYLQWLIRPEVSINEITGKETKTFVQQAVDFYLAEVRLVVEIDGVQHTAEEAQHKDEKRDAHLLSNGVTTARISTKEWKAWCKHDEPFAALDQIRTHLALHAASLSAFATPPDDKDRLTAIAYRPAALLRLQTVALELLRRGAWVSGGNYQLSLKPDPAEPWLTAKLAAVAVEDLLDWVDHLTALPREGRRRWDRPNVAITTTDAWTTAQPPAQTRLDFSLSNRWSEPGTLLPRIIYCRNDYDQTTSYYQLQCAPAIPYQLREEDKPTLEWLLLNLFRLEELRPGQYPIISSALNGEDTIGLLPTGGGKSLCYQLPCLLQPTTSFVVAPIISLMEDQVHSVRKHRIHRVASINSLKSPKEKKAIVEAYGKHQYHWIYISPERFQIASFRALFTAVIADAPPALGVIDEVHCLSEWGHDFRVSYLTLVKTLHKLTPSTKLLGLTATASVNVLQDLKAEFSHNRPDFGSYNVKSQADFSRRELAFEVVNLNHAAAKGGPDGEGTTLGALKNSLAALKDKSMTTDAALVFAPHVNGPLGVYHLRNQIKAQVGISADWFSGSCPKFKFEREHKTWHHLSKEQKEQWLITQIDALQLPDAERATVSTDPKDYSFAFGKVKSKAARPVMSHSDFSAHKLDVQRRFTSDKFQVMIATKAFGMGIDKPNISHTYHFGLPAGVEALYQEAGRAGRGDDFKHGKREAKCTVLYQPEGTHVSETLNTLLAKGAGVEAGWKFVDALKAHEKNDLTTQLYLYFRNLMSEADQTLAITEAYDHLHTDGKQPKTSVIKPSVAWNKFLAAKSDFKKKNSEPLPTAVYRLSLLGFVDDWTVDFADEGALTVNWLQPTTQQVRDHLLHYLRRYDKVTDFKTALGDWGGDSMPAVLAKAAAYLVPWTAANITYNRLQALKTLVEYCDEYEDSETFKAKIDSYFQVSDRTVILQHVLEHPFDVARWREVFDQSATLTIGEPTTRPLPSAFALPKRARHKELIDLRNGLRRFLESNDANPGLNIISGLTRLALGEFGDADGERRLREGLTAVRDNDRFTNVDRLLLDELLVEVFDATPAHRAAGVQVVLALHPTLSIDFVDRYNLLELAVDRIARMRSRLEANLSSILEPAVWRDKRTETDRRKRVALQRRLTELDDERLAVLRELETLQANV